MFSHLWNFRALGLAYGVSPRPTWPACCRLRFILLPCLSLSFSYCPLSFLPAGLCFSRWVGPEVQPCRGRSTLPYGRVEPQLVWICTRTSSARSRNPPPLIFAPHFCCSGMQGATDTTLSVHSDRADIVAGNLLRLGASNTSEIVQVLPCVHSVGTEVPDSVRCRDSVTDM